MEATSLISLSSFAAGASSLPPVLCPHGNNRRLVSLFSHLLISVPFYKSQILMFRPITTRRGLLSLTVDQQRCDNIGFISSKILSFWYIFPFLFSFFSFFVELMFRQDFGARIYFIFPKKIYLITNLYIYIYSPKASLRGNLEAVGVPTSVPVRVAHELLQAGHRYLDVR